MLAFLPTPSTALYWTVTEIGVVCFMPPGLAAAVTVTVKFYGADGPLLPQPQAAGKKAATATRAHSSNKPRRSFLQPMRGFKYFAKQINDCIKEQSGSAILYSVETSESQPNHRRSQHIRDVVANFFLCFGNIIWGHRNKVLKRAKTVPTLDNFIAQAL